MLAGCCAGVFAEDVAEYGAEVKPHAAAMSSSLRFVVRRRSVAL